ncbi:MAG: alpha/beta hydrolase [Acidimicrobiales bacterium]
MSVVTNNVQCLGPADAMPVLFAHGFGCGQEMWRDVVPTFVDDHRVVLFDHVGCGGSDPGAFDPQRHRSLDGYAADVVDIIDELALTGLVFVGHSVSGMIGVLAAARRPEEFAALVLVSPSPRYIDDGDYRGGFSESDIEELLQSLDNNYLGWARSMAPTIMANPERPELGEELADSFCRVDPGIAKAFAHATFRGDNRDDLAGVHVPTLILQSARDAIAAPHVGEYVHQRIPDSELVVLDVSGHCPNLSAPQVTSAAIRRFVDDLSVRA